MEYVKGEAKEAITGLPHTPEGYEEAKAILERKYGRGSKVKRAVLKELEELSPISYSTSNRLEKCHQFYNKLSKTVRTLKTLRALESSENSVYQIMDKLGPIRDYLIQKDDHWEEWGLQELVDNLERYVERNPLPNNNEGSWRSSKRDRDIRSHRGDHDKRSNGVGNSKPFHEGRGSRNYYGR